MSELDAEWERILSEAARRARVSGRGDVSDYLALRVANDQARAVGIKWLIETFNALAGDANRVGAGISFEQTDAHRFSIHSSTMVGTVLTLRVGLRTLTVEAGWPRLPTDGIVRGGGLASARVSHFGDRTASDELLLVRKTKGGAPQWLILETTGTRAEFLESRGRSHIKKLVGNS